MKEILFKAKRIDNGEWVEGSFIDSGNHEQVFIYPHYNGASTMPCRNLVYHRMIAVDVETICQYTGLTDKNGNKIWENNVVKCNYNDYGEKGTYIGKVIFRKDICTFIVTDGKSTDYEWWNEEKEVIGNIFDNADLLKGE